VAESVAVIDAKPGRNFASQFPHALIWKTCLREIAILDGNQVRPQDLQANDQLYSREDAYRFLLEVICGLQSPVVGETEVLGQFKNFAQRAQEGPGGRCTAPWIQRLIADAKRIRTNHLTGMGGRSYGRLAHRHVADCPRIFILGAGHLAQEMLPWFSNQRVDVFCRRPEDAAGLLERHANGAIHRMTDPVASDNIVTGLIIAAPLSASEITAWVRGLGCAIETIVDLRGESRDDRLEVEPARVVHFSEILADVETNCRVADVRVERARQEILRSAQQFWDRYEIRPYGWEDLCA
jgi:glutamyl-tRNA reductase